MLQTYKLSFWKQPWNVPNGVRTRSQEKDQKKVTIEDFNKYFQNIVNIQRWLEASDSEMKILNENDEFYIVDSMEKIKKLDLT